MIGNFNTEVQNIIVKAKEEMINMKHPYVGTEHLILGILSISSIKDRLKKYNLTYDNFKKEIIKVVGVGSKKSELLLYTPLLKKVIENAILDSRDNNNGEVTVNHLLSSLLEVGEGIAIRTMIGMDIDVDNMYDEFTSGLIKKDGIKNKNSLLLMYGIDLTEKALNNELDPVINREKEIKRLIEILCRRYKNNPLLIGYPGVGKTAIVEELCNMIIKGNVPKNLLNKRIISLDMASMVAGTKYRGEFEDRMKKIIKEAEEDDTVILFIDEIHTLVGAGGAEGAIDASNILKPALARGKIRCIGATTTFEYKKSIEKDGALERRFGKVDIKEPSINDTKDILFKIKPIYEKYHNVIIDNKLINDIVNLSSKYIYDKYFPDKAIDVLDEVCSSVSIKENNISKKILELKQRLSKINNDKIKYIENKNIEKAYECKKEERNIIKGINDLELLSKNNINVVTINDIANIIHSKTDIPIYEILKDNVKVIKDIKDNLEKSIIGQDIAINELINITKRIKLGYKDNKCYSIMFTGPSGVGKTHLASIYAKYLNGSNNFIKIDMSEYSDSSSVSKFLGANPGYVGYDDYNNVLEEIRNKPSSVILLDEIDKAHSSIINLFYSILEDGYIKDSKGNIINFNNNIIIMTSNSGYEVKEMGFINNNDNYVNSVLSNTFKTSFINRIDSIVKFNYLSYDNIRKIIDIELSNIKNKYNNISINISNNYIDKLINEVDYLEYGARKIKKYIKNKVESNIIDYIIEEKVSITFDYDKEVVIC